MVSQKKNSELTREDLKEYFTPYELLLMAIVNNSPNGILLDYDDFYAINTTPNFTVFHEPIKWHKEYKITKIEIRGNVFIRKLIREGKLDERGRKIKNR
jgi:hypothetical protein